MSPFVIALVAAPLLIIWGLHKLGFNAPIVRLLCLLATLGTLGKWHPNPDNVDETSAIAIAGAGLAILTLALGFAFQY